MINDLSKNPYAIILLDEIEKAHPDVSNILLQMLDEGKVTGSNGKTVSVKNSIIIMTSNLGSADNENNNIGFGRDLERTGEEDRALKEFFKPELRNRIDCVCKFHKLSKLAIRKIVIKFVDQLKKNLAVRNIRINLDEPVIDLIIERGYDSKMGARPLGRKIDELIKVPLSKLILFEDLSHCTIDASIHEGEIKFDVEKDVNLSAHIGQDGFVVVE